MRVPSPTNAVGGSFILSLQCSSQLRGFTSPISAVGGIPNGGRQSFFRLDMNNPPTALWDSRKESLQTPTSHPANQYALT